MDISSFFIGWIIGILTVIFIYTAIIIYSIYQEEKQEKEEIKNESSYQ